MTARKLEDVKLYFYMEATTYNVDYPFENILTKYKGEELKLKDRMRFVPVVMKAQAWVHAMHPQPLGSTVNWPLVARHMPFKLQELDGEFILEFVGIVMNKHGKYETGSCTDFEEIFTKLIAPRYVRFKNVQLVGDSGLKRIDEIARF